MIKYQIYNIFYFNCFNIQITFQSLQNNILFQNKILINEILFPLLLLLFNIKLIKII